MSDKMTPISFKELLNQAIKEYKREKTIYYVIPFSIPAFIISSGELLGFAIVV